MSTNIRKVRILKETVVAYFKMLSCMDRLRTKEKDFSQVTQ